MNVVAETWYVPSSRVTTLIITLLAVYEYRKDRGIGAIRLGDETPRLVEGDAVSIRDVTVANPS